ncbi:MAG: NAD(P)-binding domain-containing protein, partial [Ginsengibacter sp.]
MLQIALLGYGKMGKAIEEIALKRGHKIVLKITDENLEDLSSENISKADVAIEFSTPASAVNNILFCLQNKVPVISGTTGWLHDLEKIEKECVEANGTFLYASNFSVGVNLFFELNKKLAS